MELTERIFDNSTVCCKTTELHLFSLQNNIKILANIDVMMKSLEVRMTMRMRRRKGAICEWDLMMASTHPANHSIPHHLILTVWMEPIGKYHYVAVLVPVV